MQISSLSTPSFDYRRQFSDICAPGLNRFLTTSAQLAGDGFDAYRRSAYLKSYARDLWRVLKAAQSDAEYDEWSATRAAEVADEFEFNVTDSERRAVADPNYFRPFGGGAAYDREMALQALSIWADIDEQDRYGAEAVAEFLPIAKAARGGKDDDPAMDNHTDCLAQAFVSRFIAKKKAAARAEVEAEPVADAHPKAEEPRADAQGAWKPKAWCWQDPRTLPRLEALYGGHYYRGEVVATVAPGGVGKSMHSIVEALAMITGKPLLGELSRGGLRVMLMNYEDFGLSAAPSRDGGHDAP